MEPFEIHILGCGSAKPTREHTPACQVVSMRGKLFMIDCGEAAQIGFSRQGLSISRLGHIFISHNHGDHVFGLPGLISSMALLGRTATLHIHGPQEMEVFLNVILRTYCEGMDYEVQFHPVDTTSHQVIYEDRSIEVWSLPLQHRVSCCGYLLKEKPGLPHIRREMIEAYDIPVCMINNIKAGADWTTEDGTVVPHERLTTPAEPPRSFAYCSDTSYLPNLAKQLQGTTLIFHEATYPEEFLQRAAERGHSTARQAAMVAREAGAGQLCIGHYSGRIKDEAALRKEATEIFPNTILAREGLVIKL